MKIIDKIISGILRLLLKLVVAACAALIAFYAGALLLIFTGFIESEITWGYALIILALSLCAAYFAFRFSFKKTFSIFSITRTVLNKIHGTDSPIEPFVSNRPHAHVCNDDTPLETDEDGNVIIRTSADRQKFYAQYTPFRVYYTKVVGVTFQNKDGTDRQAILSRCNSWDEVSLEPFTYRGDPAYAVWTRHGQIGNLSADDAAMIATVYADFITLAEIKEITGGKRGQYYGCNLTLTIYSKNAPLSPPSNTPDPNKPAPAVNYDELSDNELIPFAVDVVLETGQASVSMLQRRMKLGYARAARVIDEMEELGLVGPFNGSKPRQILITRAQWEAMRSGDQ